MQDRPMQVVIEQSLSKKEILKVGVQQCSVLGWLLFTDINYPPLVVKKCKNLMYADNVVLYHSGKTPSEVRMAIQEDFNRIARWSALNSLVISTSKTSYL
jgi:hypothetical protein